MTPIDVFWLVVGLGIYFLPSLLAYEKGHTNTGAILILNLFLGWTFLGWVAALIWTFKK